LSPPSLVIASPSLCVILKLPPVILGLSFIVILSVAKNLTQVNNLAKQFHTAQDEPTKNPFICSSSIVPISYIANAPWLTYNTATKMKNLVLEAALVAVSHPCFCHCEPEVWQSRGEPKLRASRSNHIATRYNSDGAVRQAII